MILSHIAAVIRESIVSVFDNKYYFDMKSCIGNAVSDVSQKRHCYIMTKRENLLKNDNAPFIHPSTAFLSRYQLPAFRYR